MDEKKSSRHRSLSARSFETRAIFSSNVKTLFSMLPRTASSFLYRRRRRRRRRDIFKRPRTRRVDTKKHRPRKTLDHLAASNENTNFPLSASSRDWILDSACLLPLALFLLSYPSVVTNLRNKSYSANIIPILYHLSIDLSIRRRPM